MADVLTTAEQTQTEVSAATEPVATPAKAEPQTLIAKEPEKGSADKDAAKEPAKAEAPTKYSLKAQQWDAEALVAFEDFAREQKLTPEKAQEQLAKLEAASLASMQRQFAAKSEQWAAETKADKALGGANLDKTIAAANKVLNAYPGGKELRERLNESGYGNRREVIGFLAWVQSQLGEDGFVAGDASTRNVQVPKDFAGMADVLYGPPKG